MDIILATQEVKALVPSVDENIAYVGELLSNVNDYIKRKGKSSGYDSFREYFRINFEECNDGTKLSRRTAYDYMWMYKYLHKDSRFVEWFNNEFQVLANDYGFPVIQSPEVLRSKKLYKILRCYSNYPKERRRHLEDYFTYRMKGLNKNRENRVNELLQIYSSEENATNYDKENKDSEESQYLRTIPEVDNEKTKLYYTSYIGDTCLQASRVRIVISPAKSLIHSSVRNECLSTEDEKIVWNKDIVPLLESIQNLLIVHKCEKGYPVNDG